MLNISKLFYNTMKNVESDTVNVNLNSCYIKLLDIYIKLVLIFLDRVKQNFTFLDFDNWLCKFC